MDPLVALGLVCNVTQLIHFGLKAVDRGRELASKGWTEDHSNLETIVDETRRLCGILQRNGTPQAAQDTASSSLLSGTASRLREPASARELSNEHTSIQSTGTHPELLRLTNSMLDVADQLRLMTQGLRFAERGDHTFKYRLGLVRRVVKSMWQEKDIQDLRQRLHSLQHTTILGLAIMQSQASATLVDQFNALKLSIEEQRDVQLRRLNDIQQDVLDKAAVSMDSTAVETLSHALKALAAKTESFNHSLPLLISLQFDEMHSRGETIATAHSKTFDWIFEDKQSSFAQWLKTSDGIFWISGKPGSGKSTLMKHVMNDRRTADLLSIWADGRSLLLIRHYFWTVGIVLERSKIGMLRMILYQIINHFPELAETVNAFQLPAQPWTTSNLARALDACSRALTARSVCVCYFIDGLDECEDDHGELLDFISQLNLQARVKVCVASRPWNIFRNAYHNRCDAQIMMQNLTQIDIENYILDTMSKDCHFQLLRRNQAQDCIDLTRSIVNRAQGVFLWVVLVVRSLLRGLGNEDGIKILHKRLDRYPETLDGYFSRMFERIEDIYQMHGARILLLAQQDDLRKAPLTSTDIDLIAEEIEDPSYAETMPVSEGVACMFSAHEVRKRITVKYMDARVGDLMESCYHYGWNFIHRTVKDYLSRSQMIERLKDHAGSEFDLHLSRARMSVASAKRYALTREQLRAVAVLVIRVAAEAGPNSMDCTALKSDLLKQWPALESKLVVPDGIRDDYAHDPIDRTLITPMDSY